MEFKYYYRKGPFIGQSIVAVIILGFIFFWMRTAFTILSFGREIESTTGQHLHPFWTIRILFTIVPIIMIIIGLIILGQSLVKLISTKPVVAGDGQGLQVTGKWFKTHRFMWDEIDYLRYEHRMRHSGYYVNNQSYFRQTQWLIVKPKDGRSAEVDITHIDGNIDDVVSDIKKLAPHILIKGLE